VVCEPKAGSGLADLVLFLLTTKAGRGLLATAIVGGGLYLSTQLVVTLPLIVPLVLGGLALAGIVTSLLYRQQSKANAAVANATQRELAAERTRIHVRRVRELEATRPAVDALPVLTVREEA
jgi:hypothetical protein